MDEIFLLGAWVRRTRKALDLTQKQLATQVGYSKELVAKIEADAHHPSGQGAALLAEHLQLSIEERKVFVQAARARLTPDRLPPTTQRLPSGEAGPPKPLLPNLSEGPLRYEQCSRELDLG